MINNIRPARGLVAWFLKTTGFRGITLPWGIFILPGSLNDARLIKHEQHHVLQIKRYGVVGFYVRYAWYSLRYGYWNNPLEVEARQAES